MAFKIDYQEKNMNLLVAELEINNEETFHLKNLYKLIHEWMIEENFSDVDSKDDKFEHLYFDRTIGTGAKEHIIWWRCHRYPQGENGYYEYFLKINWRTINMRETEVVYQGHKFKTNKGEVILRIKAYLMQDHKKRWRDNPFLKYLEPWFRKRVYKQQLEAARIDLYKTAYRLHNVVKQYLLLKTPYELPKPFQRAKGV